MACTFVTGIGGGFIVRTITNPIAATLAARALGLAGAAAVGGAGGALGTRRVGCAVPDGQDQGHARTITSRGLREQHPVRFTVGCRVLTR